MTRPLSASLILMAAVLMTGCDLSGKKTPPDGTSSKGASFQIKSIKGAMETDKVDPVFLTPTSRLFNFEACVIDNLYQKQVSNQAFSIWMGDEFVANASSEENGCITWQERRPLNYFAHSEYVFQTRTIRGEGASRGQLTIPLAINPWIHGEALKPVVDLEREQVKHYNAVAKNFLKEEVSYLWIENLELQNIHEVSSNGGRLVLGAKVQFPAQFLTKDSNGADVLVPIQGGLFDMELIFYVEGDQSSLSPILDRVTVPGIKGEKGLVTADVKFSLSRIPTSGYYKLGLRLTPKSPPTGLRKFEGVLNIASVDAFVWTGNVRPALSSEVYGKQGVFNLSFLETEPEAPTQNTAYFIDKSVGCSYDKVDTTSETPTTRSVQHRIQLCIKRRDGQEPREGIAIKIRRNKGDTISRNTNENGCVDFEDSVTHNFYEPECRFLSKVRLTNADLGLDEEASFQLNPWHGYGTFCRDARIVGPEELALMEDRKACMAARPKSEFFMDAFDMNEQFIEYKIDNSLNLTVQKTLRLGLFTRATRPSNQIDGAGIASEPLRQGYYLFRYAVVRNGYENPDKAYGLISGGERIIYVRAGRPIVDVPIAVKDRKVIDSRNRVLFELSTIDYKKIEKVGDKYYPKSGLKMQDIVTDVGLAPARWEGNLEIKGSGYLLLAPFDLKRLSGTAQQQLEPYQAFIREGLIQPAMDKFPEHFNNLGELVAMGEELNRLEQAQNKVLRESYAEMQDLRVATPTVPLNENLSYESLVAAIEKKAIDKNLYRDLCEFWAYEVIPQLFEEANSEIKFDRLGYRQQVRAQCQANRSPGLASFDLMRWIGFRHHPFFVFQNVVRAEEAKYISLRPPGRQFQIQIGDNFSMGSRFVNTTDITVRAPISKIPVVGQILEMGPGISNTSTFRSDHGNDMVFGMNTTLTVEENQLNLQIDRYSRCMIARMNPEMMNRIVPLSLSLRWIKDDVQRDQLRRRLAQHGFMVCGPEITKPLNVVEKYFYMQPPRGPGWQQDATDIRNRWHSLEIRGMRDMKVFMLMGKGQMSNPEVMDSTFDGLSEWTANMDELFSTVTPAAPGIYLEDLYF